MVDANPSQFMPTAALNTPKNVLLNQTTILVDANAFHEILEGMDAEATPEQADGLKRLRQAKPPWPV